MNPKLKEIEMTHEHIGEFHADKMTKDAEELLIGDLLESNQVIIETTLTPKMVNIHMMTPDGDIQRVQRRKKTKVTRIGWYDGI